MAWFSLGSGLIVLSQLAIAASYKLYPAVFDGGAGIIPSQPRDILVLIFTWASFCGLLLAVLGFSAFAFKRQGANNAT